MSLEEFKCGVSELFWRPSPTHRAFFNTALLPSSTSQCSDGVHPHPHPRPHPGHPVRSRLPGRSSADNDVILPQFIYIKDSHGLYLDSWNPNDRDYYNLRFLSVDPSYSSIFKVIKVGPSRYKFIDYKGRHVVRYDMFINDDELDWYTTSKKYDDNAGPAIFNIIVATGNTVYLKDSFSPSRFFSDELLNNGTPLGRSYINESSGMQIAQAALKNEILNVEYDIPGAKVLSVAPTIALETSVRNDSDGDVNQTLSYTYEKWTVGTWNNSAGVEIGMKASFSVGVPFVADSKFEISVTGSYSHEWGGEEGTKQIITSSTTVTVPPKKKARVTILVLNAKIDVGFTYTQQVLWSTGETEKQTKSGIYNNVDSWFVEVKTPEWEDV